MAFKAVVLADSLSPAGHRLTTFEATYPRIVHSEMMTHRMLARNSASTRAIPLVTQLRNLLQNPFIPERFGVNQPGMQAFSHLVGLKHDQAVKVWLRGRDRAVTTVIELILGDKKAGRMLGYSPSRSQFVSGDVLLAELDVLNSAFPKSTEQIDLSATSMLNVHKQLAGRGLEAYMWHTAVITATEFDNFYALRDHPEAQGEIATIARLMRQAHEASTSKQLAYGEWHTPYVEEGEFDDPFDAVRASAARCAAVSYNRQHNRNPEKEFERYDLLLQGGHMSPLEHQATPFSKRELMTRNSIQTRAQLQVEVEYEEHEGETARGPGSERASLLKATQQITFSGNLRGFTQHRKQIEHEEDFGRLRAQREVQAVQTG